MARARNIKPGFFKNELLGQADPLLSLLFISLWTLADREGRLEDRPLRIKAETFPYREVSDFNGYLTQLEQLAFIERYKVGDLAVIQIVNFRKHQAPHNTEKPSELPEKAIDMPITVKPALDNAEITQAKRPDSLIPSTLIPEDKTSSATDVAAPSDKQIYPKAFIAFWELYPIRVNKGAAFKAFQKIRAAEYPVVRAGLERKKQSQAWLKDNGKFIPHAATWLNARGWEDEDAPAAIPAKPTYRAKTQAEMDAEQEQRRVEMEERKRKILAMPVEPNPWEVNHV